MSESDANLDSFAEFNAEMQMLTGEAERELRGREASNPAPEGKQNGQILRSIVLQMEELNRSTEKLSARLQRMESAIVTQSELPDVLVTVKDAIEHKNFLNQQLFDALHAELRGYRDGLLLEILQKPIILNLISFFDDLEEVSRQASSYAKESCIADEGEIGSRAKTLSTNLENTVVALLEILERMEVSKLEVSIGQHLDKVYHRAVKIESADSSEQDGEIADSHRAGFLWKGRVVRPEEVTVRKFNKSHFATDSPEASES